jgi:hypothetical protein
MHTLLKELAEQAGYPDYMTYGQDKVLERFAELIVRECVTICNDTNDASYLNGVIAGRKIQKHFGVEE